MSGAHFLPMWDRLGASYPPPTLVTENKTLGAWLPKADKQLAAGTPPQLLC